MPSYQNTELEKGASTRHPPAPHGDRANLRAVAVPFIAPSTAIARVSSLLTTISARSRCFEFRRVECAPTIAETRLRHAFADPARGW